MKKVYIALTALIALLLISGCGVKVNIETRETSLITENDAVLSVYISDYEKMPSSVGVYFGTDEKEMSKIITDKTPGGKLQSKDIDVEYDINVDGDKMLEPDTTYYYQFYARFDNKEALGEVKSFKTAKEPILADVSVETLEASDITEEDATLNAKISDFSEQVTEAGMYFGTKATELRKIARDKEPMKGYDLKSYNVWYTINRDAGLSLTPDTTYYYQAYAKIGNAETRGEVKSFTTPQEKSE